MKPDGAMAATVRALAEGCVTAAEVADVLGVPVRTARCRLWHLQRRGVISTAGIEPSEAKRNGRPPHVYEVVA